MMSDPTAIAVLNRLLAAEYESLIPRLREADPFVTLPAAADRALLDRMAADALEHERALVAMILDLRGAPAPRRHSMRSGDVHYVDLTHLLPAVIEDVRRLVAAYESAGPTGHAGADALVARLLADHRRHLAALEERHGNLAPPAHGDGQVAADAARPAPAKAEPGPAPAPTVPRPDAAAARG